MGLDIEGDNGGNDGLFERRDVRETANIGLSPNITDFSESQHNHSDATSGGAVLNSTIDHNATTNTHNLTTDINHDALLNFTATEHFTEASINHTNIQNIGTKTHAEIDTGLTASTNHIAAVAPHSGHVDTTGNETIAGIKTFSSSPIVPTPTTDFQASTKKYVDDNAGGDTSILSPVGAVVAWLKSFTNTPQTLPTGWVECDGSVLSDGDSVYNGQTLPDLNGGEFLRGNATSGGTGGESTHTLTTAEMPAHTHTVERGAGATTGAEQGSSASATMNTGSTGSGNAHENKPPYYDMVWIMRIK